MNFLLRRNGSFAHWVGSGRGVVDSLVQIGMTFPYRGENEELDPEVRKKLGGTYIRLSGGVTHYELSNSQLEGTVVLVHGFSIPCLIYDPTFKFLAESGFRVLRYDLFGRGFSDRPYTRYDIRLFIRQLDDLLDALRLKSPVNLVGVSMGGPITAGFTAEYPDKVGSLTLIDPAGVRPITLSPLLGLAKIPVVAETFFGLLGTESMVRSAGRDFYDPGLVEEFMDGIRIQMRFRGYKRAILSSIRNNMLGSFVKIYGQLGKLDKPVLLVWGRDDTTVPLEHSDELRRLLPDAEFHVIEHCGHVPHYEKPGEFHPILLNFLRNV